MSDEQLRALERAAAAGDPEAELRARLALCRTGQHHPKDTSRPRSSTFGGELTTPCIVCGAPVPVFYAVCNLRFRPAEWALISNANHERESLDLLNDGPDPVHLGLISALNAGGLRISTPRSRASASRAHISDYVLHPGSGMSIRGTGAMSLAVRPRNVTLRVNEWDHTSHPRDTQRRCLRVSLIVFVDGERISGP